MNNTNLMTIPELMKFLKVKRNTIYTLRKMGLPTVKIGRSVRFRADSILRWLSDMEQKVQPETSGFIPRDTSHLL
jgi:excisionase family DNA binding protein